VQLVADANGTARGEQLRRRWSCLWARAVRGHAVRHKEPGDRFGRWGHFWGHRAKVLGKVDKVGNVPAPTSVRLHKGTRPSKLLSVSS
jgi:hypothetical protein